MSLIVPVVPRNSPSASRIARTLKQMSRIFAVAPAQALFQIELAHLAIGQIGAGCGKYDPVDRQQQFGRVMAQGFGRWGSR